MNFFLPHRNESRGLGGIFFDYLNSDDWNSDMNFVSNVGKTFINTYKTIVQKQLNHHGIIKINYYNFIEDQGMLNSIYYMIEEQSLV